MLRDAYCIEFLLNNTLTFLYDDCIGSVLSSAGVFCFKLGDGLCQMYTLLNVHIVQRESANLYVHLKQILSHISLGDFQWVKIERSRLEISLSCEKGERVCSTCTWSAVSHCYVCFTSVTRRTEAKWLSTKRGLVSKKQPHVGDRHFKIEV